MSLIERLRGQGRVEVVAVYDADPAKRLRGGRAARPEPPTCRPTPRSARTRTSTSCSCSRACPSTAGWRARRSRPASTCSSRSRSRPRWRRPRRCSRSRRPRRAICSARRTSCSPPPTGRCTRACATGAIGGLLTARARYGWAGPGLEPLVLRARRRRAVRPRRLQRHEPVRLLRAGAARDRDDRRRDPRAGDRRRADARAGRGQRARADRLRRRALRRRHHRLHDAALPLPVRRAVRHARRAADARRRLGARGLRAVAQRPRGRGSCIRRPTRRGRGPTGCATSSSASRPARSR